MSTYRTFRLFALIAVFSTFSAESLAAVKLHYAGIAYMGNYSAKDALYKYSSRLIDNDDRNFQQVLLEKLAGVSNESFDIIIGGQPVDYKNDDALIMAFALEHENVSMEKIDGVYKFDVDIRANILVFDYNEMKIVSSYPIAVQLRDAAETRPTDSYLEDVVRDLYLTEKYKINIFDEFVSRLSSLTLKESFANTIKVSAVTINNESKSSIPGIDEPRAEEDYKAFVAQMFSTYLSKNQNVSVLPYTKGHAIGNRMALQVANGDVYSLSIPDETYSIELELIKLKKAQLGENKYKSVWGYASYFDVKLLIPGVEDVLVNAKFRSIVKKSISHKSEGVDDWSIYKESMYRLFDDLTVNISKRDTRWLENVTATENITNQLKVFNQKIESCL